MFSKIIVIIFMLIIVFALSQSLVFLMRDKGHGTRMIKALTWRIALSLTLFILLFVGFKLGWISPHGI